MYVCVYNSKPYRVKDSVQISFVHLWDIFMSIHTYVYVCTCFYVPTYIHIHLHSDIHIV